MATVDKLFAYTCDSCGGHLDLSDDKTSFICKSCGNSYDYNYFLSDDLLKKAKTALSRKEFQAASDMYKFMLKKDPSNFEALVGKLLAEANIKSVPSISAESFCEMPEITDIDNYVNSADYNRNAFFVYFRECMEIASEVKKRRAKMERHKKAISTFDKQISDLGYKAYSYYIGSSRNPAREPQSPKSFVITIEGIFGAFVLFFLFMGLYVANITPMLMALTFIIPMAIIYFANKKTLDAVDKIEAEIKGIKNSRNSEETMLKELDFCNTQDMAKITGKILEMKKFIK